MMRTRPGVPAACVVVLSVLAAAGCTSRSENPVAGPDSTLAYPARRPGAVDATITLCREVSKKSGKRLGAGQVFTIKDGARVLALVDLQNEYALGQRELDLHLVWLDPSGKPIFVKRETYTPGNEPATVKSAISIAPDKRGPGPYTFRVYLFRELIAEKRFRLRSQAEAAMERERAREERRAARAAADSAAGAAAADAAAARSSE
jgi:hypothetical protein